MPSHIFTRLGGYRSRLPPISNTAKRRGVSADFHDQLHSMDYLVYAYLQVGQDSKAKAVLDDMNTVRDSL